MSKRHRKMKMFAEETSNEPHYGGDVDTTGFEAPKGKRPRGKGWGKAKRNNQKTAYWD